MQSGELYTILGLSRGASAEEIKQAYRRLARRLHPDRNADDPVATERFRQVSQAYGVLSDERKRRIYDRRSRPPPRDATGAKARADEPAEPETRPVDGANAPDERAGRKRWGGIRRRGADLLSEVVVDLHEAVRGCERALRVKTGRSAVPRVVRVRIPPGVRPGEKLRVRGMGRPGARGGGPGDLWLRVRIRSHPHFFLERGELHGHLPVTPLEAYAGAVIEVPTPHGAIRVRVPPRSQPGTKLRVRELGIRRGHRTAGDLVLHLKVILPMSEGLVGLYRPLDEALGSGVRRGLRFE
jgi:curved DNA-binding protein